MNCLVFCRLIDLIYMFHQIGELTSWVCLLIISIAFGLCLRCNCHDDYYSLCYLLFRMRLGYLCFPNLDFSVKIYYFNGIIMKFYIPCILLNSHLFSSIFNQCHCNPVIVIIVFKLYYFVFSKRVS